MKVCSTWKGRARLAALTLSAALTLLGCHELGNPVTRTTEASPFPAAPPHETVTRVTYAHASEAVAWRRPPAHALDPGLPSARYIARVEVVHPPIEPSGGRVRLATTVYLSDGTSRTTQWLAPADAAPWWADLALPVPPARALTRILR